MAGDHVKNIRCLESNLDNLLASRSIRRENITDYNFCI